jgi:hypothetical protein
MRVGISGTHGTGKTTLAQALCARLPGHVSADEPYYLLEEQGHEFNVPPSPEDYRALLACSVRSLDLLVITPITAGTEQQLPPAEMPELRAQMNDALLDLVYDDPLGAWEDLPVLELTGPLAGRLDAILAALGR